MSHMGEYFEQLAVTPGPRRDKINSAWDCFTTASKTARVYRSVAKSVNRQMSFAADLIASNEEMEHPENIEAIANQEWTVYSVSPLWNVQYKSRRSNNINSTSRLRSTSNESTYNLGEEMEYNYKEYDKAALKRYARVISSYLIKSDTDCVDTQHNPYDVDVQPMLGLRGWRKDKDALIIEAYNVDGSEKVRVFRGILCGIETSELRISSNDATCLPVFLTDGTVDVTERVIYGLTKCFDCVISHLLFPKYELEYAAALWTGLGFNKSQNMSDIDCSIQPTRKKSQAVGTAGTASAVEAMDDGEEGGDKENQAANSQSQTKKRGRKVGQDNMILHYKIPEQFPQLREKISSIKISLSFPEIEALWSSVHDPKENTVTEQEMEKFHEVMNAQIYRALGLKVNMLKLESVKLPYVSISEAGKIRINDTAHVKIVLRNLTAMCQEMLGANPSLGIADDCGME